jgi:hypothetical protein
VPHSAAVKEQNASFGAERRPIAFCLDVRNPFASDPYSAKP